MELLKSNITEITWDEVRADFKKVEPELTQIIDKLSPGKNYPLLQVAYPFGSLIFDEAKVHLPSHKYESIPISHSQVPGKIKDHLGYSSLPLGCVINLHGIEIFRELDDRFHSISFFNQGLHLGIWEFFERPTPFSISAGARSLMMLPKISDNSSHAALKKYGVVSPHPRSPFDQWQIFREMASHENFSTTWNCNVVYFTEKWIGKIKNDNAWLSFKYFILKRAWEHIEYSRNRFLYDETWESFF